MNTICELVREAEARDTQGNVKTSKYVDLDFREDVNRINAYLNSKFTSGSKDAQGRDKPFFNIVNQAVNIHYRATDIDRKNIKIKADKSNQFVLSFLFTILLQDWMKKAEFGKFLNTWGLALAKYLEVFVKFVEKDGELHCKVVPWDTLIIDPENPVESIKIEKLYYTPSQLRKQNYDKEFVKDLIENTTTRKLLDGGEDVDSKDDYIPVYEVHGELPLSYLTGKESDEDTFVQQMQVISFIEKRKNSKEFEEYTLFSGREKDPYLFTTLLPSEDGSLTLNGAVKNLFEAQWMVNNSAQQIKDHLDLASKMLFQTSDGNFVGQNALKNIKNGDILIYTQGNPLTQINNKPDIAAMQAYQRDWQSIANQINGIADAMIMQAKSGTAWRQTQAELQEAHSLFELYTENKGIFLEIMLRQWVIPFLKKKIDTTEEISSILEDYQVKQLDMMYVPNEAKRRVNQKIKDTILSGKVYDPTQQAGEVASTEEFLRQELSQLGNQRFIKPSDIETKTWKEVLKDVEGTLEIDITGENRDVQAALTTYNTILTFLASLQGRPMTQDERLIFNQIVETAGGISPIQLNQAQPVPQQPAMANAEVGGQTVPMQSNS